MAGLIYVDSIGPECIVATSDGLTLRLESDGAMFSFRLSHHAAVGFSEKVKRDTWQLHCAPDGDLVSLTAARRRREREKKQRQLDGAKVLLAALDKKEGAE